MLQPLTANPAFLLLCKSDIVIQRRIVYRYSMVLLSLPQTSGNNTITA